MRTFTTAGSAMITYIPAVPGLIAACLSSIRGRRLSLPVTLEWLARPAQIN